MHEYIRRAIPAMYPKVDSYFIGRAPYHAWLYPPHFIPAVALLTLIPYWWAYAIWLVTTLIPYLAAMARILPTRVAIPLALAAPPVFYNTIHGQNGFLLAGLIGLGLSLLGTRPLLAGMVIGLASIKPHLGLLIPVALVAGGYWRAIGGALLSSAVLIVLSLGLLGSAPWLSFFANVTVSLHGFELKAFQFIPMTSVLASFAMAGADIATARLAQFVSFLAMLALVAWSWWHGNRRPELIGLQCALLCLATPLALPMVFMYDLVLIAPALAWLGLDFHKRGASRLEWAWLIAPTIALLSVITVADSLQLQIGAPLLAMLLALAVKRNREALLSPPAAA